MTTQCHPFPGILTSAVGNPLIAAKRQFKLTPIKTSEMLLIAYLVVMRVPSFQEKKKRCQTSDMPDTLPTSSFFCVLLLLVGFEDIRGTKTTWRRPPVDRFGQSAYFFSCVFFFFLLRNANVDVLRRKLASFDGQRNI